MLDSLLIVSKWRDRYDGTICYDKMKVLTNELLELLAAGEISQTTLAKYLEKVALSEQYFTGPAADAFRARATSAVKLYSSDANKGIIELIYVAQTPRNNAEVMQMMDKIVAKGVNQIFHPSQK